MRLRDEQKKINISKAVFDITRSEGLSNLSISKISKHANISPATVYIYYKDKTDMLSQIYLEVKEIVDSGLAEKLNSEVSFVEKFRIMLKHFAQRFREYPLEVNFMRIVQANPEFVTPETMIISSKLAKPVFDLLFEGIEKNYLVTRSSEILIAMTFAPLISFIEQRHLLGKTVSDEEIDEVIELAIKSVIAK